MKAKDFYDRLTEISAGASKIEEIILSLKDAPIDKYEAMSIDVAKFYEDWAERQLKKNKGYFWEIRKKVIRDAVMAHYEAFKMLIACTYEDFNKHLSDMDA